MRPAPTQLGDALKLSHQLATSVDVLVNAVVAQTVTTTISGTVTIDATAQSRSRMDLVIVDDGTMGLVPVDADSPLAPYGNELQVKRGVTYPDGTTDLVSLGVFRIDRASPARTPQGIQVSVSGLDRSVRFIDARFEQPYEVALGTNYATAILQVLQDAWPEMPYKFTAVTQTAPKLTAEEGADRWAFAQTMATSLGMDLYFDGDGVCVLRPVMTTTSDPVVSLLEGANGLLLEATTEWTRDGNYNRVIATGENTGQTAAARGVATDDDPLSPTYYFGPYGRVPMFYASQFITTNDQAQDAAEAMLARELGTTQTISFGGVVDPRLEPGDVIELTRAGDRAAERHVIDSLMMPLAATEKMTGRTRATTVTA